MWSADGQHGDWIADRTQAISCLKFSRVCCPGSVFKLQRLVTKREKLKRKLLARSEQFEQDAQMHAPADKHWYRGYARALRDVAGML